MLPCPFAKMLMRPIRTSRSARRVRSASGEVYSGCNVENVAYPEGTCAEAGAIAAMVAAGEHGTGRGLCSSLQPAARCRLAGAAGRKLAEFGKADVPL